MGNRDHEIYENGVHSFACYQPVIEENGRLDVSPLEI